MGVKFVLTSNNLEIYCPDGEAFLTFVELGQLRQREKQKIEQLEQAQQEAISRLHDLGLTVEQIANSLSLSIEEVEEMLE